MRALIVSAYPPPAPGHDINGGYRRFGMFVRAAAEISEKLEFLQFLPPQRDAEPVSASRDSGMPATLLPAALWDVPVEVTFVHRGKRRETAWGHYGAGVLSISDQSEYFSFGGDAQIAALKARLNRKPDFVFVAGLASMIPFLRLRPQELPPIFFDINDVDHRLYLRTIFTRPFWPGKLMSLFQIPALIAAERRGIAMSANAFVCSDLDLGHLRLLDRNKRLVVVPNAVEMPDERSTISDEPTILFLGFFGYAPNATAANRLIQKIFPLIRQRLPAARLIIAGKSPEFIPSYGADLDGVEFAGFVDDLAALYRRSRLICCPMINGGGTRVKLIEAAGYATPIVSTAVGAEGLSLKDGVEILIEEDDASIAEACIQLLNDKEKCARIGDAARRKARSLYDIDHIRSRITALLETTIRQGTSATPFRKNSR